MDKEQALKLVGELGKASVLHYEVANRIRRGVNNVAANRELKAANNLLKALGVDATQDEVSAALGW